MAIATLLDWSMDQVLTLGVLGNARWAVLGESSARSPLRLDVYNAGPFAR